MLSLRNGAAVSRALSSDIDPELRALIARRVDQLQGYGAEDIGELVHFLVVEPGDTIEAVEVELGFSPLVNFVDGTRHGEPAWTPSWEVAEQHGDWFQLVFVLGDDGFGWVIFIADDSNEGSRLIIAIRQQIASALPAAPRNSAPIESC